MAELEPGAEKNDLKVGILYKISVLFKMNNLYGRILEKILIFPFFAAGFIPFIFI